MKILIRQTVAGFILLATTISFAGQNLYMHAHRGEPFLAPQNTAESIKLAFDLGARMIETDFFLTKDGTMLCIHNRAELKEIWGIDKDPKDLSIDEIRTAKLANPKKFDSKYAACKLPTIDEIFAVIPKDKWFELEIKGYGPEFADKVDIARKKAGLSIDKMFITSFNWREIKDFKSKYPAYNTLYIVQVSDGKLTTADSIIARAKDAGAVQIAVGGYKNVGREFIKKIQDAGFKVGVWQVDSLDDLAYAVKLGADRICSNRASKIREGYNLIKNVNLE